MLMQNQCGDVTMRVLEYESQRAQALEPEAGRFWRQVRKEDMLRRQMRLQELGESCTQEAWQSCDTACVALRTGDSSPKMRRSALKWMGMDGHGPKF